MESEEEMTPKEFDLYWNMKPKTTSLISEAQVYLGYYLLKCLGKSSRQIADSPYAPSHNSVNQRISKGRQIFQELFMLFETIKEALAENDKIPEELPHLVIYNLINTPLEELEEGFKKHKIPMDKREFIVTQRTKFIKEYKETSEN